MAEEKSGKKVIALNREARHEYFVVEALETGIERRSQPERHLGRH